MSVAVNIRILDSTGRNLHASFLSHIIHHLTYMTGLSDHTVSPSSTIIIIIITRSNLHHLRGNAIPTGPFSDFLSDFLTKLGSGEAQVSLTPNFTVVAFKMWAYRCQIGNFWYKFATNRYISLAISTKFGMGRNSKALTLVPNLTIVTFLNVGLRPQNCRNW